jgi:hypothetical protein
MSIGVEYLMLIRLLLRVLLSRNKSPQSEKPSVHDFQNDSVCYCGQCVRVV